MISSKSRTHVRKLLQLATLLALVAVMLSFQNCAKRDFALIDPDEKLTKLDGTDVFGGGSGRVPATGKDKDGSGRVPANSDKNGAIATEVPFMFFCSNSQSKNGNLAQAKDLKVEMISRSTAAVTCSFVEPGLASKVMTDRGVSVSLLAARCGAIANGQYRLTIKDAAQTDPKKSITQVSAQLKMTSEGMKVDGIGRVISDFNPEKKDVMMRPLRPDIACDDAASPLVVHMDSDVEEAEPLVLTSQARGVQFDIFGLNSDIKAHAKSQISWHRSRQYLYIVLPNEKGEVNGINELFGDNTRGPDGKFSSDGYHALAKYDGTTVDGKLKLADADGYITESDAIFSKLRLWQDRNFNGVVEKGELLSLAKKGIEVIDLNFDAGYSETDRYGNQTKFKSVVKDKNGKLHLLFDIWFKPAPLKETLRIESLARR